MVLFLGAGVVTDAADGFYALKSTARQRLLMSTAKASPKRDDCHLSDAALRDPGDSCEYFSRNVEFATFGDSHAVELAYALAERLRGHDIGLRQLSLSECPPSYSEEQDASACESWTEAAIQSLVGDPDVETVVVTYRIHAYLFGEHEDSYPDLPCAIAETERRAVWDAYITILRELVAAGKEVVLVLQAPELPERMEDLIYDPVSTDAAIEGLSRQWWTERMAYLRHRLAEIPAGVIIVDPADLFCDEAFCYAATGDIAYYFDDDHMSVAGASIVADEILSRLRAQRPSRVASTMPSGANGLARSARAGSEAVIAGRLQLADARLRGGSPRR